MELEAGKEVQNDLLEGVEGGLGELEERLKVAEEAAAALESSLRGTITEEVEGQLAEWRAEVSGAMPLPPAPLGTHMHTCSVPNTCKGD